MKKIIFVSGCISGLIVAAFLAVLTISIKNNSHSMVSGMFFGYAIMLLAFSIMFIAVKNYRDKQLGGAISFGQALSIGLGIALIGSLFYVVTWLVLYATVVPDFMDKYAAMQAAQLQKAGKTAAEIQKQMAEMDTYRQMYRTWYGRAWLTFLEIFPVGLLVSLVCALVMMRKRKPKPQIF